MSPIAKASTPSGNAIRARIKGWCIKKFDISPEEAARPTLESDPVDILLPVANYIVFAVNFINMAKNNSGWKRPKLTDTDLQAHVKGKTFGTLLDVLRNAELDALK